MDGSDLRRFKIWRWLLICSLFLHWGKERRRSTNMGDVWRRVWEWKKCRWTGGKVTFMKSTTDFMCPSSLSFLSSSFPFSSCPLKQSEAVFRWTKLCSPYESGSLSGESNQLKGERTNTNTHVLEVAKVQSLHKSSRSWADLPFFVVSREEVPLPLLLRSGCQQGSKLAPHDSWLSIYAHHPRHMARRHLEDINRNIFRTFW